jgi:hypothetical protein
MRPLQLRHHIDVYIVRALDAVQHRIKGPHVPFVVLEELRGVRSPYSPAWIRTMSFVPSHKSQIVQRFSVLIARSL